MRVGLDGTPLLGVRTGIGTYVAHLVRELSLVDGVELTAVGFTGRAHTPVDLPAGVQWRRRPVPARVLRELWKRVDVPQLELLAGQVDVFHATNFVLPPTRSAGVLTIHDLTYERFPELVAPASRDYRTLVPRGLRRARVVVTPSAAVADEIAEVYDVDRARIVVTPLGVGDAWFSEDAQAAGSSGRARPDGPYVVFLGTREPRKNLRTVLAALGAHRARGGRTQVVLVGPSGWDDVAPAPGATIAPHLPGPDVRDLIRSANALLMPSLYEGFGLPVLEAMAAGTPVAASDIRVLREIGGSHIAQYVEPTDVEGWAEVLDRAADGPIAGAEQRADARTYAAGFTWSACAEGTLGAYRLAVS